MEVAAAVVSEVYEMYARSKCPTLVPQQRVRLEDSVELRDVLLGDVLTSPIWSDLNDALSLRGTCAFLHGPTRTADWLAQLLAALGFRARLTLLPPLKIVGLAWHVHAEMALLHDLTRIGAACGGTCCVAGSHALHRLLLLKHGVDPAFNPGDIDVFVSVPAAQRDRAYCAVHQTLKEFFAREPGQPQPQPQPQPAGGRGRAAERAAEQPTCTRSMNGGPYGDALDALAVAASRVPIKRQRVQELFGVLAREAEEMQAQQQGGWIFPLPQFWPPINRGHRLGGLKSDEGRRWAAAMAELPEEVALKRPYSLGRVSAEMGALTLG